MMELLEMSAVTPLFNLSIRKKQTGTSEHSTFTAGEPVGVLAATAMSNPAYKAVLDSSPTSNNSWDMMKVFSSLHKKKMTLLFYKDITVNAH